MGEESEAPFVELTFFPEDVVRTPELGKDFVEWADGIRAQLRARRMFARYENASWALGDVRAGSGVFLVSEVVDPGPSEHGETADSDRRMYIDRYIEVLELLADLDAQKKYERDVPIANVPAELICMWFDDLAVEHGYGDLSAPEQDILREFTEFYGSRVDALPTWGMVDALHACTEWVEITLEARKALTALKSLGS
jgi:hypothetical protein